MIARFQCDDDALASLLSQPSGNAESDVITHLNTCAACQSKLESFSSGGLSWDEVNTLMRLDALSPVTDCHNAGEPIDSNHDVETELSFLQPSDYPNSLGRFARYEIMEILGRGGMGIVLRGYDTSLNRHSAIKVLAPELASSGAARKRFSREAKNAAAVVHPHVVPIQTVDEFAGLPFLVMPVIDGESVETRVTRSGPLSVTETVRIAWQVAEGLAAAHQQGLVHRDIKPANILLENGVERVQITDFGLARAIDDASMTRSGVIAGTPQYMSPEQAHGDAVDHRSDLFSLGSLIYFMLTGRSPFRAETTMGVLNRIVHDQHRSLQSLNPDVPPWLEEMVATLLAKTREERPETATGIADSLRHAYAHLQQPESVAEPQLGRTKASVSVHSERSKTRPRHRWLIAAATLFVLSVLASIFILETSKGTIRIETNSESSVPIIIKRGDKVVDELTVSQAGETTRLKAGDYIIEVAGGKTDFKIEGRKVALRRGETWLATITHQPNLSPKPGAVEVESVEDRGIVILRGKKDDVTKVADALKSAYREKAKEAKPNELMTQASFLRSIQGRWKLRSLNGDQHTTALSKQTTGAWIAGPSLLLTGGKEPVRYTMSDFDFRKSPIEFVLTQKIKTPRVNATVPSKSLIEVKDGLLRIAQSKVPTPNGLTSFEPDENSLVWELERWSNVSGNPKRLYEAENAKKDVLDESTALIIVVDPVGLDDSVDIRQVAKEVAVDQLEPNDQFRLLINETDPSNIDQPQNPAEAFRAALRELSNSDATRKHVILLTCGKSDLDSRSWLSDFIESNISVSTIHFDSEKKHHSSLYQIAKKTGGRSHSIIADAPKALILKATRNLIQEEIGWTHR